ncbi:MAG TPA: peptidylprolyl isomerase [Bacteroidia bacterium]|nr:peptidylprolyl isomerase [Bacteroidia bacterium]
MWRNFICLALLGLTALGGASAQTLSKETVVLETSLGTMKLKLFEETPLHKANFLKLVKEGVYDSLLFHRVINNFMIQGGDPLSKRAKAGDSLGHGDLGYTIPAEFRPELIHKKGRLCAARESDDINPKMASSASQFYLVMGKQRGPEDLKKYEDRINKATYSRCARAFMNSGEGSALRQTYNRLKSAGMNDSAAIVNALIEAGVKSCFEKTGPYHFSPFQVETYTTLGGTPHLDGSYTVFGEVIEGMDLIDKIAAVKTDKRDRPLEDIRMKMHIE